MSGELGLLALRRENFVGPDFQEPPCLQDTVSVWLLIDAGQSESAGDMAGFTLTTVKVGNV